MSLFNIMCSLDQMHEKATVTQKNYFSCINTMQKNHPATVFNGANTIKVFYASYNQSQMFHIYGHAQNTQSNALPRDTWLSQLYSAVNRHLRKVWNVIFGSMTPFRLTTAQPIVWQF